MFVRDSPYAETVLCYFHAKCQKTWINFRFSRESPAIKTIPVKRTNCVADRPIKLVFVAGPSRDDEFGWGRSHLFEKLPKFGAHSDPLANANHFKVANQRVGWETHICRGPVSIWSIRDRIVWSIESSAEWPLVALMFVFSEKSARLFIARPRRRPAWQRIRVMDVCSVIASRNNAVNESDQRAKRLARIVDEAPSWFEVVQRRWAIGENAILIGRLQVPANASPHLIPSIKVLHRPAAKTNASSTLNINQPATNQVPKSPINPTESNRETQPLAIVRII